MYRATNEAYLVETPELRKGMIERSNVNLTEEMVEIISSQRALQSNSQALKMYDLIMESAANQIGRIN